MASANPLSVVLTADEFLTLNDTVRVKLEECLRKHEQDSNQLRIQFSQLQTSSEQQCFELDNQLQHLREQQSQEGDLINELTNGKNRLDSEVASLNEQRRALESKVLLLESSSLEWKREKDVLLLDKEDLSSLLARRNDDLDRLTSELKSLTDQLVYANKEKTEAMIKSEELSGKQLALDYKEKRLDQERELLIKQRSKLQEELDARTMEIMSIRREKTSKVLELQDDLAEKIEELRLAQKTISEMTITRDGNEKQIKELNDKLRDLSESDSKIAENHRNELRTQMRLTELYKESSDDFEAKSRELSKAVEELQRLLGDASVRFGDLESETKAEIDHLKDQLATSTKKIADQKKELELANGLIDANRSRVLTDDAIESMSPSAAAASRLLKSGMTLTQIFSKYCDLTTDLQVKEAENKQLNDYLDNILKEIEDRAPTIARQREDYEKTVEMVASLTRQLDLAVDEAESEKEKAREAQRMLTHAERSGLRFEKQVKDLSKQVSFLVREIEILRGNRMRDSAPPGEDHDDSSSDGSAAAVISRRLVTFRDVMELQERNQQLLTTLREVTEKQDEEEQNAIETKTARIQQVLENALAEIEQHRETRRRHEQLMESVIQERDMYRTLVQEAGLNESRSPTKFRDVVTSTPAAGRHDTSAMRSYDLDKHSSELKEKLKEQETSHQALIKEMKDTEKTLKEQIQSLQATVSDVRTQNVRLATQAEYIEEKSKLLQGNLDSCKNQLNSLEEKNRLYSCTVAKHEQSIAVLRDEAMNAQQLLARAEVKITMLQEEKQLLIDAEHRLRIENSSLQNHQHSQSLLHVNLESIKLNLERSECETRMRLQNQVTSLEQQLELLRKKLDLEEQRYRDTVKSFEDRIEADKASLKTAEERAVQAETQLSSVQEQLAAAENRTRISSPVRKAQITRLLSTGAPAPAESELVGELRSQLAEVRSEAASKQEQLESLRQQVDQYRSIADSMEEQLKKSNEAGQIFRRDTEQHLLRISEERNTLARNLQEAQEKLKAMEDGAAQLGQATAHQSEEVSLRISRLETELASVSEQLKRAEELEAAARQDCIQQAKHSKEAQEKYERELMQHAADVETLNAARAQLELDRTQLGAVQQTLARVEQELANSRSSWNGQREMLEKEVAEKSRRCAELDKQVDLMQQQIVTLSARMAAATRVQEINNRSQAADDSANVSLNASVSEDDIRNTEQLLELVRFLRREKEIAISKFEVMEAESQRLKTQLEQAARQHADAQAALQHERERSASSALTSEKHTEMLRRLETLNALADSNRLLRDERATILGRVEELTAKVLSLETELEPLRANNREATGKLDSLTAENDTLRKQVQAWQARTNALQNRAAGAAADNIKRLQTEKEQLQKQFEQSKEAQTKTATLLQETQRINTQLANNQQKLQEEIRKAKEETTKLQSEMSTGAAKRDEDSVKAAEQLNQLRRIARKYKTQYEELKAQHDQLVTEKDKLSSDLVAAETATKEALAAASAATAASAQSSETEASSTQNVELEQQLAQLKEETAALRVNDEKMKNLIKTMRQKIASNNALAKEKETLTAQLLEARATIESNEQSREEQNVRAAAIRSQDQGRITRLENEKAELVAEIEALNQRLPILQRQLEAFQKQKQMQQQLQQQQPAQQITQSQQQQQHAVSKTPPNVTEKTTSDNPPTANIKPTVTAQRPAVISSPGQVAAGSGLQLQRTTPTASIRPMAMAPRTVTVTPMAAPPLVAITSPSVSATVSPTVVPIRDEVEPVAGPSSAADTTDEGRSKKRARGADTEEDSTDPNVKRSRVQVVEEEEEQQHPIAEELETSPDDDASRPPHDVDMAADYEEQQQEELIEEGDGGDDQGEIEQEEEGEEGLIESEEGEHFEDEEHEQDNQEDEEEDAGEGGADEIIEILEEQSGEADDHLHAAEAAEEIHDDDPVIILQDVAAVAATPEELQRQQPMVEEVESEAFVPATGAPPGVGAPAAIRPPPREDRLPSFGRNTLAFEDGGDDGIVPSTPVLLRPRTNEGFAEAVSSPQVNTRFVFGSQPELSLPAGVVPVITAGGSTLESQGMEDTRMDLGQLEESSGRNVPDEIASTVTLVEEPLAASGHAGPSEEQSDFEGGPDLEGDAAAELDLLGDDDQEIRDGDIRSHQLQEESEVAQASNEGVPTSQGEMEPVAQLNRGSLSRRSIPIRGGRGGLSREEQRVTPASSASRTPIVWSSSPQQEQQQPTAQLGAGALAYRENPARGGLRRVPGLITSPAAALSTVPGQFGSPFATDPIHSGDTQSPPVRGRGGPRGRIRARVGRRM